MYQVAWPWKSQNPDLPVNLDVVIGRMRSLARYLQGNPDLNPLRPVGHLSGL